MFDTILQLPLFQGLAHDDFTCILEKVKLHFTRHKAGEKIATAGENCTRLIFVLKGSVSSCTTAKDASYSLIEYLQAPCLFEAQSLFGMSTTYVSTYAAEGEVHTVSIDKRFVLDELLKYEIFRLNYINLISNRTQILNARLWEPIPDSQEERISRFILHHCERYAGTKVLKIKMEKLAQFMNETRLSISKTLNSMQDKGLLELHRGEIVIPEASLLICAR